MVLMVSCALFGQHARTLTRATGDPVTSVVDESWLKHIGRPFSITSMGKTWELGPSATEPGEFPNKWRMQVSGDRTRERALSGSDVYRLNCRGCHGEFGAGFTPEINSLIDPVRATSPAVILQRMKNLGMNMPPKQARELAQQAEAALLQRIHSGGENMPSFNYLAPSEVQSLVSYLKKLAEVPGATIPPIVQLSSIQIGEHIVKSLCHICHDATGANPTPEQLESGVIPPLASLIQRKDLSGFIQKVAHGAPVVMGNPATLHAGRMPVFNYLTQDEIADAYFYLVLHPPEQLQVAAGTVDAPLHSQSFQQLATKEFNSPDVVPRFLVISAISMTCFLLFAGLGVTTTYMLLPTTNAKAERTKLVQVMKRWNSTSRNSEAVPAADALADEQRHGELGPERIA
jgi:mono/diheme cytochrome c family protein